MPPTRLDDSDTARIGWVALALLLGGHVSGIGVDATLAQDLSGSEAYIKQVPASDRGGATRSVVAVDVPSNAAPGGEVSPNAAAGGDTEDDGEEEDRPSNCELLTRCQPASTIVNPIGFSPPERGGRNVARVTQMGTRTTARIVQRGSGHDARVTLTGLGTSFTAVQRGSRNLTRSSVGRGNSLSVTQDGTNLTYIDEFDFQGSGLSGKIVQRGSDLLIVQEGSWPEGFQITQNSGSVPGRLSSIRIQHR